jgi:hypothetical protein
MHLLSIVACEMLEGELVYVPSTDFEIKHLYVVENRDSLRFVQKLKSEKDKVYINKFIYIHMYKCASGPGMRTYFILNCLTVKATFDSKIDSTYQRWIGI